MKNKEAVPYNQYIEEVVQNNSRLLALFSELKRFDFATWLHSYRVGIKCFAIAVFQNLNPNLTKLLTLAGVFHDIGKICLPPMLINKVGKLTEEEKMAIVYHARIGYYLLVEISYDLAYLVYFHHLGSTKKNLPQYVPSRNSLSSAKTLFGSISPQERDMLIPFLICADQVDALLHPRIYRKEPWEKEKVYQYLVNQFPCQEAIIRFLISIGE